MLVESGQDKLLGVSFHALLEKILTLWAKISILLKILKLDILRGYLSFHYELCGFKIYGPGAIAGYQ
jgi:hypothetical protein